MPSPTIFNYREDDTSAIDPISIVTLLCECDHVKEKQCLDAMLSQRDVLGRKLIHYAALRGASVSCCRLIKVLCSLNKF